MLRGKKVYQMELDLGNGKDVQIVPIPNAKEDLSLTEVKEVVGKVLNKELFIKNGMVAKALKAVYVTEVKELQ